MNLAVSWCNGSAGNLKGVGWRRKYGVALTCIFSSSAACCLSGCCVFWHWAAQLTPASTPLFREPSFGGNVWECVETLQGGVSCMLINDGLSAHTQTETVICLIYFSGRLGTMVKKIGAYKCWLCGIGYQVRADSPQFTSSPAGGKDNLEMRKLEQTGQSSSWLFLQLLRQQIFSCSLGQRRG